MARVTLADGTVIEGTIEEFKQMGVKFTIEDTPEPLKVGDFAKTLAESKHGHTGIGEIVKIESTDFPLESGHTIAVRNSRGGDGLFKPSELLRATDEEIAEAKLNLLENAEAEKWVKIGRKPNEFKEGDIVRGERYDDSTIKFIGEVEDEPSGEYIGVRGGDNHYHAVRIAEATLITPVEARFDR
jgi:hypothetical protein